MNAAVESALMRTLLAEQRRNMIREVRRSWPHLKEHQAEEAVDNATVAEGAFGSSAIVASILDRKGREQGNVSWGFDGECPTCEQSVRFKKDAQQ
jgi:hypothetical protein